MRVPTCSLALVVGWMAIGCAAQPRPVVASVTAAFEPAADEPDEPAPPEDPAPPPNVDTRARELAEALDRSAELWRCVGLAERGLTDPQLRIALINDEFGAAARPVAAPMPGRALLQACVDAALPELRFAPITAPVVIDYDPSARRPSLEVLGGRAPERDELDVNLCPGDPPLRRCKSVSAERLLADAIWLPETPAEQLAGGSFLELPNPLAVALRVCVDPGGRTTAIQRSQPGPGQAKVDRLIATVRRWRIFPLAEGGERITACAMIDFTIAFESAAPQLELERPPRWEPAPEPLRYVPPRALSTPLPSHAQIRRARWQPGAWLDRGGTGWWTVGRLTVGFCVDTRGRTHQVDVVRQWGGDRGVTRLLLSTVRRWRFIPATLDGAPQEACVQQTFALALELERRS